MDRHSRLSVIVFTSACLLPWAAYEHPVHGAPDEGQHTPHEFHPLTISWPTAAAVSGSV